MSFNYSHACCALVVCFFVSVKCADILLISNCISHSHSLWYNKLATVIVNAGHQVVLLDTDPLRAKVGNITHFLIEDTYNFSEFNFTAETIEDMSESSSASAVDMMNFYFDYTFICRKLLNSQGVSDLMEKYRDKKFDLIIMDYYCDSFLALIPYFGNPPFIIATAFADPEYVLEKVGLYDNPSYVPIRMFTSLSPDMDFFQRASNLYYYAAMFYKIRTKYLPFEEESVRLKFGADAPSINEIGRNVSLVMVNTHFALSGAKPILPAVIPMAGFHIDDVKPLPEDIKQFIEEGKDGAVLFSFGTNIPSELISLKKAKMYLKVFSSLPQRFIWKFNESLIDETPSNILMKSWLPQTDILAHEKVVAFISHGGLLGTQEAMFFGVPVIGVPFSIDQISNIDQIVKKGLGEKLSFKYVEENSLRQVILKVTNDKSYRERMKVVSKVLQDRPMSPKDVVKYWIEYVLRNKDNLNIIRSQSANLEMYQLLMLDVLAAIIVIITVISLLMYIIIKLLVKGISLKRDKTKTKHKNQ